MRVVGLWAPILLLMCKLVRVSFGGEYTGAAIFVAEYSPDRRRGFLEAGSILARSPDLFSALDWSSF